jgi:hypothetical protein
MGWKAKSVPIASVLGPVTGCLVQDVSGNLGEKPKGEDLKR